MSLWHDALIEAVVTDYGGRLLKSHGEGDATFSVFEVPTAAVVAAAATQQAMASEEWPGDALRIRIAGSHRRGRPSLG